MSDESIFDETQKIAAYAPYGTRKTQQISYLIDMAGADNVGLISAEKGLNTIRSCVNPDNVRAVNSLEEFKQAWKWASETFTSHSQWVCIDGGTRVMGFIANNHFNHADRAYELVAAGHDLPADLKRYGRYISQKGQHIGLDTMGLYGIIGRDSENLLNALVRLPCSIYMNFLEDMTESDGRQKMPPYGPDVPGKVGLRAVMSSFDYVLRFGYNQTRELVATTGGNPMYLARTREDRAAGIDIPKEIVNFRMDAFVRLITQSREAAEFNQEAAN